MDISDYSKGGSPCLKTSLPKSLLFLFIPLPFPPLFKPISACGGHFQASTHAQSRASLHLSRRGKRLSGQERYGCENEPDLAATRTRVAKSSLPEAEDLPSCCHAAGLSNIQWTL